MNPEQLWETTMDPDTRTLVAATLRRCCRGRTLLHFMGEQVEPRREFIETNALDVKFRLSWGLNKQGNLKEKN